MIVNGFCKRVLKELPMGVRRGSAEAARRESRRSRGMTTPMLEIRDCMRTAGRDLDRSRESTW